MRLTALVAVASVALLSGCSSSLYTQHMNTAQTLPADAFAAALRQEYVALAMKERAKPDFPDATTFAQRAAMVAKGSVVLPDDLTDRGLLAEYREEMTAERAKLLPLLDQTRGRLPALSAQVQGAFDCWAEEQEEDFQRDDIAACRGLYFATFAQLQNAYTAALAAEEAAARAAAEAAALAAAQAAVAPVETYAEVQTLAVPENAKVLFDLGSAKLTADAQTWLQANFVPQIQTFAPERLEINGYTDTTGSKKYNEKLSLARAEAVKSFLLAQGVTAAVITTTGFGEAKLFVPTADNVKEPANRVVEVILKK